METYKLHTNSSNTMVEPTQVSTLKPGRQRNISLGLSHETMNSKPF